MHFARTVHYSKFLLRFLFERKKESLVLLDTERQIKQVLQQVVDPVVTSRSIVSTGLVQGITIDKDQHRITLDLELFVPGHPYEAQVCLLSTVSYLR